MLQSSFYKKVREKVTVGQGGRGDECESIFFFISPRLHLTRGEVYKCFHCA
jgi:hypothetical protein